MFRRHAKTAVNGLKPHSVRYEPETTINYLKKKTKKETSVWYGAISCSLPVYN
jgi:hypothetical protein